MSSPIALTSPPHRDTIFKKRSLSYVASLQSYLTTVSEVEVDARARMRHSASVTSTPPLSLSSSTTSFEGTFLTDTLYENSDGLVYPTVPPTSEQLVSAGHLQFGFCPNDNYRYKSSHKPGTKFGEAPQHDPPHYILFTTYLSYLFLICIGHIRDFFGKRFYPAFYRHLVPIDVSMFPCLNSRSRMSGLLDSVSLMMSS